MSSKEILPLAAKNLSVGFNRVDELLLAVFGAGNDLSLPPTSFSPEINKISNTDVTVYASFLIFFQKGAYSMFVVLLSLLVSVYHFLLKDVFKEWRCVKFLEGERGSAEGAISLVFDGLFGTGEAESMSALSESRKDQCFQADGASEFVERKHPCQLYCCSLFILPETFWVGEQIHFGCVLNILATRVRSCRLLSGVVLRIGFLTLGEASAGEETSSTLRIAWLRVLGMQKNDYESFHDNYTHCNQG
jgi:hypothetical protein